MPEYSGVLLVLGVALLATLILRLLFHRRDQQYVIVRRDMPIRSLQDPARRK
jgi:hypothetical protein